MRKLSFLRSAATENALSVNSGLRAIETSLPPNIKKSVPTSSAPSFSKINQTALYPGLRKEVKQFDGQHVHTNLAQNIEALKESKPWFLLVGGVAGPFLLPAVMTSNPAFWPLYASLLLGSFRFIARGKRNTIRKDLTGKTILLLGGTGDIGREVANELLSMGATVVIASRSDEAKVEATREYLAKKNKNLISKVHNNNPKLTTSSKANSPATPPQLIFMKLDISYLSGIRHFCKTLKNDLPNGGLHMIINCSGVMFENEHINKYGDEDQLSTNALGPYLLIESLLPDIKASNGRIVHVTSSAHVTSNQKVVQTYLSHKKGLWNPKDKNHAFDGIEQYGFTKLCNIFHAQDLAARSYEKEGFANKQLWERHKGEGSIHESSQYKEKKERRATSSTSTDLSMGKEAQYTACAANPGGVITHLFRNITTAKNMTLPLLYPLFTLIMRTPKEGSQTILHCCLTDDIVNGGYYQNCRYAPNALSSVACSKQEREVLLEWIRKRTYAIMDRQAHWKPK